jgi:hypothetical protein
VDTDRDAAGQPPERRRDPSLRRCKATASLRRHNLQNNIAPVAGSSLMPATLPIPISAA